MKSTIVTIKILGIATILFSLSGADAFADRGRQGQGGQGQRGQKHPSIVEFQEELGLSQSQVDQIQEIEEAAKTEAEPLRTQLRTTMQTLRAENPDLRGKDLKDDPSITAIREQLRTQKQKLRESVQSVLTEQQLEEAMEIRQERRGERGQKQGGQCEHGQRGQRSGQGFSGSNPGNEI